MQRRKMDSDVNAFALEKQFLWAGTTDGTIHILNKEVSLPLSLLAGDSSQMAIHSC